MRRKLLNIVLVVLMGLLSFINLNAQDEYDLTVNVTPPTGGDVTADPSGPYTHGDVVTLTALPATGYS
ncbi:MAG: hypothetical protein R6T90_04225, partial [Dissulfuribacterales bacterium]